MEEPRGQSLFNSSARAPSGEALVAREVAILVLGLSACWVAAGSVGLLAAEFRHALMALLLMGLGGLAWPAGRIRIFPSPQPPCWPSPSLPIRPQKIFQTLLLLGAILLFGADSYPVLNLLCVVLVAAGLASLHQQRLRCLLTSLAWAGLVFGVHRLAVLSIPTYWHLTDRIGAFLGKVAGKLGGYPLEVGANFAGVDFLVLSFVWCLIWGTQTGQFKAPLIGGLVITIMGGHLLYLLGLAYSPILREKLPPPPPRPQFHVYLPPGWSWSEAVKTFLPWGVPWIGMALHLSILGLAARWIGWGHTHLPGEETEQGEAPFSGPPKRGIQPLHSPWKEILLEAGPVGLALGLGTICSFWGGTSSLAGKSLLAYVSNPNDWEKPSPQHYSRSDFGRFGLLPELVLSLGGRWHYTSQLAERELAQADLVLLVGNLSTLSGGLVHRLEEYVRSGGALLVAWEGATGGDYAFSENALKHLLAQWGVKLQYETAVPVWGDWAGATLPLSHPVGLPLVHSGTFSERALLGWERSATLALQWPASPVLVGLGGYADPGREAAHLDFLPQYDPGERLGDVVLAAETPVGSGRVGVLGSADCFLSENLPSSYLFIGQLLGFLAHRAGSPVDGWRQVLGLGAGLGIVILLAYRPRCTLVGVTAGVLGAGILAGWWQTSQAARLLPQPLSTTRAIPSASDTAPSLGSLEVANSAERNRASVGAPKRLPLAYIDASHMEAYSLHPWHPDGLGRLFFSLMQAGYFPLLAPDMKPDRLQTAAVWLSIAPARSFSRSEQRALQEYVQNGGIFIAMAGAEDAEPLRPLLARWGLQIPRSPVAPGQTEPEAEPVGQSPGPGEHPDNYGQLRTYYLNAQDYGRGDYLIAVTLYAPWPVQSVASEGDFPVGEADVLVRGYEDVPIVVHRRVGSGSVVVIGDTYFATNKNFDETGGQPTARMIENAHFWRWMLSRVGWQQEWIPPDPQQWLPLVPPEPFLPEEILPGQSPKPIRPKRR